MDSIANQAGIKQGLPGTFVIKVGDKIRANTVASGITYGTIAGFGLGYAAKKSDKFEKLLVKGYDKTVDLANKTTIPEKVKNLKDKVSNSDFVVNTKKAFKDSGIKDSFKKLGDSAKESKLGKKVFGFLDKHGITKDVKDGIEKVKGLKGTPLGKAIAVAIGVGTVVTAAYIGARHKIEKGQEK